MADAGMNEIQLSAEHRLAIQAALEAGAAIMEVYNSPDFGIEQKDDDSPLTKADLAADAIILRHLETTGIPVLSEEGSKAPYESRKGWKQCWIVDPLDGTKEFIKRNGEFTVNIALVENGLPLFGVVYAPALGKLYFGICGEGAFFAAIENLSAKEIPAAATRRLPLQFPPATFTMVGSRSHSSLETEAYVKEMEAKHGGVDFVASGSALKFCIVAEGKAHAYPRFAPTMEWDTAAGQAVLEAAGGSVVEWPSAKPMRYNREQLRNGWFLAAGAN
jgi:3'(2'), 5'-bisphosphate nucleotidase